MQVALLRDDKDMIGPDEQSFRDQFDRHLCIARENLMEPGGDGSQMIHNDNRHTHVCGQMI